MQSIIVYRNPIEAAFWSSGIVFPLIVFVAVFFAVFLIIVKVVNVNKDSKWIKGTTKVYLALATSFLAACAMLYHMI